MVMKERCAWRGQGGETFVSVIRDKTTNNFGSILLAFYDLHLSYLAPLVSMYSRTRPFSTIVRSCVDERESGEVNDPPSMYNET
jgi:hypothetical protein